MNVALRAEQVLLGVAVRCPRAGSVWPWRRSASCPPTGRPDFPGRWIWRQAIEATAWGRQPRYLIHDRDHVYGDDFGSKLVGAGIADIRTPYQAPLANSVAERV